LTDTCADIDSVRRIVQSSGWRRIGVDGVQGAGMAHLAQELAQALDCPALDVDDYLYRNQGGYVDFIDYPALSAALAAIPTLVLSGLCLREVLANMDAELDAHIYIKRIRHGQWADEDVCVFPDGVDAAIENLARRSALISDFFDERSQFASHDGEETSPELSDEVMRYHDTHQPHEFADLVFERGGNLEQA